MFTELAIFAIGFATSLAVMPLVIKKMKKKQIGGIDVHKKDRPFVPEMGGLAVLAGITVSVCIAGILSPELVSVATSFLGSALIAGLIGAIDDLKALNAKVKPFLTLFASLPIFIMHTYNPLGLVFPFVGRTRMTIVYPFLIPIAIAVTSNAVNMMDPFNGTMSGTCTLVTIFLLLSALLLGRSEASVLCLCLLGPLLVLYYFNRYPSKVFSGDVGSLSIGAALGAVAVIGRLEVVAVVAFAPQIMNAFYGLSSIGRLYERREVSRPVTILEDGRLMATKDPKAPITLARVILARGPLYENEATRIFLVLSAISGVLALATAYLIMVTT
jgi:UDP-N-acetylmuramyl pentapeptide phosphotransferase/UDP-N-acetylglucosamine-1-phosphate transferase